MRILSIDGGGIRGVFPAHILLCMQRRLGINFLQHFDFIAGTSTGAIIASAVAAGINIEQVLELYKTQGSLIFPKKIPIWKHLKPAFTSRYRKDVLSSSLLKIFNDLRLGDIKTPLLMPATDIGNGGVHVFKSKYSDVFVRDPKVFVRDAILASCSAPTYFDPTKVNEYLLADGGLWANCPALAAVIDTQKRLGKELKTIKILSLGTGLAKTCYGIKPKRWWGFLTGWKGPEFIDFFMSLQAQATYNYLQLLLDPSQVLRINFETDCALPMDDYQEIENLISRADKEFTYNSKKIMEFLNQ